MAEEDGKYLPSSVRPLHYNLTLTPDRYNKRFHGEVDITIEIKKATSTVKLHQKVRTQCTITHTRMHVRTHVFGQTDLLLQSACCVLVRARRLSRCHGLAPCIA